MMKEQTNDDWKRFHPKTNIFWLHYLVHKILNFVKYKNKKSKIHKNAKSQLKIIQKRVMDFNSCQEFVVWYKDDFCEG